MAVYFNAVETVYKKGLRNILFINGPQHRARRIGSIIRLTDRPSSRISSLRCSSHTPRISHVLIPMMTFYAHTWVSNILDVAADFGFKNTTGICRCATAEANDFFWFNMGHFAGIAQTKDLVFSITRSINEL
ncbi:hypothetical protein JB92DRAFT_727167 [Gautieria morchelliformis]|nr:hypothetical protein JB92DRAFT_727167 [Gautieria morchelliformis]